jgi:GNAT superfamily N-acetyltransferase
MTRLDRLDGPATAAPPFHETEVEAGFFADELAGELEEPGFRCWVASEDDLLRDAVGQGPDGAGRWLEGQFAVVWIAVRPERRGRGLGRTLLERLLATPAPTGPGSSPTTSTPRPRPSTAPSGSSSWAAAPSAGTTPNGSCSAPTCPGALALNRPAGPANPTRAPVNPTRAAANPTRRYRVPRWGRLPPQGEGVCGAVHRPPRPARCPPRLVPPGVASPRRTR